MKEIIEDLIRENLSIQEIADRTGKTFSQIRYMLKKLNLKTTKTTFSERNISHLCSCGESNPAMFYGHRKTVCKKCHLKVTGQRQIDNKSFAVKYKGGKCEFCGYNKSQAALHFHHIDPINKDKDFERSMSWSRQRIIDELDKCLLLCANCHAEEHQRLNLLV
jgi:hypothetical protein